MNTDEHGFETWMLSHSLVIGPWTLVLPWVFGSLGVWAFYRIARAAFTNASTSARVPMVMRK